ncbi:MAG TPA: hypothetical protein VIU93_04165 [Gallionellaceae bacterium]|jgi:hypothetical protein
MRIAFFVFVCSAMLPQVAVGAAAPGTYEACSQVLRDADNAGKRISPRQVAAVLNATNSRCLSSAETSEWLNEVLFHALLVRPAAFLEAFARVDQVTRRNIIAELESPVNDGIDLPKVYRSVWSVKGGNGKDKQAIISALRTAGDKAGLQLP